jgi:ABC-type ATPase with predicted acetyltransferase domain
VKNMDINIKEYISENEILMKEWDYEANVDLNPENLKSGSNKKAWWKCRKCGGKWQATICDRAGKNLLGVLIVLGKKF